MKLVHRPLMSGLLHLVQRGGGTGVHLVHQRSKRGLGGVPHPPSLAHPPTASVSILLYNRHLLRRCGPFSSLVIHVYLVVFAHFLSDRQRDN